MNKDKLNHIFQCGTLVGLIAGVYTMLIILVRRQSPEWFWEVIFLLGPVVLTLLALLTVAVAFSMRDIGEGSNFDPTEPETSKPNEHPDSTGGDSK